ncbi:unnamed protein product [Brassicogethes aeneus]|uniref:Centromere protein J n=1 Tax=Brassicogethes aeneus TaxID=1431903 RepID=A0A9P0ASN6_BRAAE|nr:unnamed protein product [Brassicogethes aeneus]
MAAYQKCLQDLKHWQTIAETSYGYNLTERANGLSNKNVSVSNEVSYEENTSNSGPPVLTVEVFDHIEVANNKPFEVLLEEKLREENGAVPNDFSNNCKPKKPFLKKGTGLNRFKSSINYANHSTNKRRVKKLTGLKGLKIAHRSPSRSEVSPKQFSFDLTPLKIPEVSIKPKTKWSTSESFNKIIESPTKILRKSPRDEKQSSLAEGDGLGVLEWVPPVLETDDPKVDSVKKSGAIMSRINEFAKRKFGLGNRKNSADRESPNTTPTKFETTDNQDLQIFEALEKRADNSSFCSTNSSVLRILSSTPRSLKSTKNKEELSPTKPQSTSSTPKAKIELENKLKLLDEKTEVINNFISKLKLIKENETDDSTRADLDSEDIWSSTGGSLSYSSSPDQFSNLNTTPKVKENFENTSFNSTLNQNCVECDKRMNEISKKDATIKKLKEENDRVNDYSKNLRKDREELNRKIRKLEEDFDEEKANLMEDVEDLHKKLQREKQIFESYKKNVHNIRKDQDDLTHLRQELIETKELLKLKETKNGATTARLRSQLKILEKENNDLKTQVEKLNRDNAKLKANQNLSRRPSETKMLSEINKNLAKLTEETKKTQNVGNGSEKILKKTEKKENINISRKASFPQENTSDELTSMESTVFGNLSLEKQYENVFGQLPAQNSSLNESKKEKIETILPDGSRQIKYSNGNVKNISADGANIVVKYYNNDIKETDTIKNIVKYFYSINNTWHTTFDDGTEYIEFPSGQSEKKYADGRCEIFYADGVMQTKFNDGKEEVKYTDGSVLNIDSNGRRVLVLPNGQKEIHTETEKRREYPDGTVKILYPDGSQETRYSNGRIRKKDPSGILILDTKIDE